MLQNFLGHPVGLLQAYDEELTQANRSRLVDPHHYHQWWFSVVVSSFVQRS